MDLKKCVKGHYYDADLYMSCPRCMKGKSEIPDKKVEKRLAGWLVGIEGAHYGTIFEMGEKSYSIGAAPEMDIYLSQNSKLSRACQIRISYDSKQPGFVASAGEARELAYINDEAVLLPRKLKARDRIRVGDEVFLFISLCDTDFAWK